MKSRALRLVILMALALSASASAGNVQYSVQLLGFLTEPYSEAYGINNLGQVVGEASVEYSYPRPFLWSPSTGMINLGTLGGDFGSATAINDAGVVVGASTPYRSVWSPFRWTEQGGLQPMERPIDNHSYVSDLNSSGVSVGRIGQYPYLWSESGAATYLGTLDPRQVDGGACGINDVGAVVGYSRVGNYRHAFVWSATDGMKDIGTGGGISAVASDITNDGYIVGTVEVATFMYRAYVWSPDGSGHEIVGLADGRESHATRVNRLGYIVGTAYQADGYPRAVIWDPSRNITKLTMPAGAISSYAYGLNDLGQVVGSVYLDQHWQATLWTPVPEPSSILTLLFGIGAMGGVMWRRRSA